MQSNLYSVIFYIKKWQNVKICPYLFISEKLIQNINQKITQMSEYKGKRKEKTGIRLKVRIF